MVRAVTSDAGAPLGGVVAQRYAIAAAAVANSSSAVRRAFDRETGTYVALKTLTRATPEGVSALKREFRLLQSVRHPNVVEVFDLVTDADRWLLSMEYVEGEDFVAYNARAGQKFDEGRLRASLRQLASAVAALHDAGVVHRALSASTVVVTKKGRVAIIDFDLATSRDSQLSSAWANQAGADVPPPTPDDIGPARDWYSVGALLHTVLTVSSERCEFGVESPPSARSGSVGSLRGLSASLPSDLIELCGDLLDPDPRERPTTAEVLDRLGLTSERVSARPGPAGQRLVGRDAELAWLAEAFAKTREGAPVTAVVLGESGIGKSALVRAFAERLQAEHADTLVLLSRCYEREFVPFKAFDGAIDALVATLGGRRHQDVAAWLSPHAGILPRIFPELGAVPVLAELAARTQLEDPLLARRLGFEALRGLLSGLAAQGPLLLAIDDIQWSDADSLALLRALLEPPGAPPVLVVCTLRISTDDAVRATELLGLVPGDVRTLRLEKLQASDAAALVGELVARDGMPPLRPIDVQSLVQESGGHPMFLAELVGQRRAQPGHVPIGRVDDVIRQRVARLEPRARRLLEVVCVAGIPTDQRVAAEAASVGRADLNRVVVALLAERLVQTSHAAARGMIEPYHNRVREAVATALSPEQLRGFHAKLALAYELVGGISEPELQADHWVKADAPDRAKPYIIRSAEKAERSLAFDHAARFYAQAVLLADSPAEKTVLRLRLAETLTNANRWREAAEIRLSLASESPKEEALRLRRIASEQLLCCGRFDKGIVVLRDVMQTVGVFVPSSPWVTLLAVVFVRSWLAVRSLRGASRKPIGERGGERVDALLSAGYGLAMTDTPLGAYLNTRALLSALDTGDSLRLARALFTEASYTANRGYLTRNKTMRLLERLREVVKAVEGPIARAYVEGPTGCYHYFHLEWLPATRHLLRAAQIFGEECVGQFWAQNTMYSLAFRAMVYLGDYRELRTRSAKVLRAMEQVGDVYGISNMKAGALAWLRLVDGDVDTAERELADVAETIPTARFVLQTYFLLVSRAHLELYSGHYQAAYATLERDWLPLSRSLLLRISTLAVVARDLRGRAALASVGELVGVQRKRRLSDVVRMIRLLEREPYACAHGHAMLLQAGVHHAEGRKPAAMACAELARVAYDKAAMRVHSAVAAWLGGTCLEGEARAATVAAARSVVEAEGVVNPLAFARMLAPTIAATAGPLS